MFRVRIAVLSLLALAPGARAAQPDFTDKAFVTAAAQVATVDVLASHCPDAAKPGTSIRDALQAWEARNRAGALRQMTMATDEGRTGYQAVREKLEERMAPVLGQACEALSQWLAAPAAEIDAGYRARLANDTQATPPKSAPPAKAGAPVQGITGYGLIQSYGMGYGGMMVVRYDPAVLFASGDILLDVTGLADPDGVAADKAAHPEHWSKWRKTGNTYEYASRSGKWNGLVNNQVWTTPPSAAGLTGRFTATGGGGNTALGGTSAIFTQTSYTFQPGGRITREGLASATSEASSASTVAGSRRNRSGRFTIDGLTLTITYDDGRKDTAILMTHPTDANIIWIDGVAYTRE